MFGVATLVAIGIQAIHSGKAGAFVAGNYFSYFTNLSNIVAACILIISAGYLWRNRRPGAADDLIRGAATLYMAVTGVVYITLLSGEELGLLLPWVNILLHYVMPVAVVADWLYQPPRTTLRAGQLYRWLIFPLFYLVYSLIRGHIAFWYPYPFLNPHKVNGYEGVAVYCVIILVVFIVLGWLLMKLGNTLRRRQSGPGTHTAKTNG